MSWLHPTDKIKNELIDIAESTSYLCNFVVNKTISSNYLSQCSRERSIH